jgi:DNA-binding NarL/FixJ family response regulator
LAFRAPGEDRLHQPCQHLSQAPQRQALFASQEINISIMSTVDTSRLDLLLVDDHTIVREGLKFILESATDDRRWTVKVASNGFEAIDCLRVAPFDVAIVDLSMPGMTGLDLIRRIKSEFPRVVVLVLSMHAEDQYALRAFRNGANGYLTKDSAGAELVAAVRKVAQGGTYVTTSMAERVVQILSGEAQTPRHSGLSDREMEVLRRIVAGQTPAEIGNALHMSVKTVSTHKSRIQEKLQLPSLAALIRYGIEHQLDQDG